MKTIIEPVRETQARQVGGSIAEILKLRRDSEHRDRWQTTWGTKTNIGVFRVVERILAAEKENINDCPKPTKLKIEIKMDSAAFEDNPGLEAAELLSKLADQLEYAGSELGPTWRCVIVDTNDNQIGVAEVVE